VRVPSILLVPVAVLWMPTWRARLSSAVVFTAVGILPVLVYQHFFAGSALESTYGLTDTQRQWSAGVFAENLRFFFLESGSTQNWILILIAVLGWGLRRDVGNNANSHILLGWVGLCLQGLYFVGHPVVTAYYLYQALLFGLAFGLCLVVHYHSRNRALFPAAALIALASGVLFFRPGPSFARLLPDHELSPILVQREARWISDSWGGALLMQHARPGLKVFFGNDSVRQDILSFWLSRGLPVFLFDDGQDAARFRVWLEANRYRTQPVSVYRGSSVFQIFNL
jgi:hypothetical protein